MIRFSNSGSYDIVSNADIRIGGIHQHCQLQAEGQNLKSEAMSKIMGYCETINTVRGTDGECDGGL